MHLISKEDKRFDKSLKKSIKEDKFLEKLRNDTEEELADKEAKEIILDHKESEEDKNIKDFINRSKK